MSEHNLLSKINSKFSSFSIGTSTSSEKDGSSADDTLIHNAFVKYFDTKQEAYPAWLEVQPKLGQSGPGAGQYGARPGGYQPGANSYANSQFQPVYYNNSSANNGSGFSNNGSGSSAGSYGGNTSNGDPGYTRSSSRLQDMYNRSRQLSVPAAGYTAASAPPTLGRTNTGRLRERMLYNNNPGTQQQQPSPQTSNGNANSYNSAGSGYLTKATWGRQ